MLPHGSAAISLLRRLINILLDNALKYTVEHGLITVSLLRDDHTLVLEIGDTGVGIPEEERPHIFNRFYRADASCNRDQGGSRLGLFIAKWISDAHHSEITVAANLNGGSVFSIHFAALQEDAVTRACANLDQSIVAAAAHFTVTVPPPG